MTRYSVPMEALPQIALDHAAATDPIGVIISSSGQDQVLPGDSLEIRVTVTNKGDKSAVIDIFLDELPVAIHPWCETIQTQLALDPGEGEDVTLRFDVPATALAGAYDYWLVVDAPDHYSGRPPHRYPHSLKVLPPPQSALRENTPTFAVEPVTTHTKPIKVLPGNPLQFQVYVYNRSDRVDRFRLRCADLPEDWVTINYPQGFRTPGLAIVESQLDLNPDMEGVILLTLTPPPNALAQTMLVTLQVKSENNPKLKLLDVLYLQIEPLYQVTTHFRTLVSRIQQQPGRYSVQATNQGNTTRTLDFQIVGLEGGDLCNYTIHPSSLTLAPQQALVSDVMVQPKHPWKRPLFGGGRVIQFEVVATDPAKKPLIENPMQGLLMWEARPWWQILPFILLLIGSFIGLMWLTWWFFIHPPAPSRVLRFAPESTAYDASNDDTVSVGFEISNPGRIQQLEIIGQSVEGDLLSGPLTYDLSGKTLPPELESFCIERRQALTCRNVRTDAKRAGEYQFILNVIPKPGRNAIPTQAQSALVAIAPIPPAPLPSIEVAPSAKSYVEKAPSIVKDPIEQTNTQTAKIDSSAVPLAEQTFLDPNNSEHFEPSTPVEDPHVVRANWYISHPEQIKAIKLIVRDAEKAVAAKPLTFEFNQQQQPKEPANLKDIIPTKLADGFCNIDETQILKCENVPTGLRQPGTYTIDVVAILRDKPLAEAIVTTSEPTQISPRPPKIISLTYNDSTGPIPLVTPGIPNYLSDFFVAVEAGNAQKIVTLNWEVEENVGTQVMILPTPGPVAAVGTLSVPIRLDSGKTILSFKVQNSAGEMEARSFSITPYDPTPEKPPEIVINTGSDQAAGATAAGAANGAATGENSSGESETFEGPPVTIKPGKVSPVELPPQFE
ncbi:COG1470 family protein [Leptothoe spongobia]|uniref:Uncharacterized protein n=1 Tax=Leptothoe spongobia TAU-MAC 1115 TaxID=1967444 RepID=A0A947GH84_9CYAN|nr:hypothetical protein [Leptothoe spongobia]MBT9314533.1 hypothetical protein [Leptothoe spongobia TAU-MAC 1115]